MSWLTTLGQDLSGIVSGGGLPKKPKLPGQGDDLSAFGSDVNGLTGQGALGDGVDPNTSPTSGLARSASQPISALGSTMAPASGSVPIESKPMPAYVPPTITSGTPVNTPSGGPGTGLGAPGNVSGPLPPVPGTGMSGNVSGPSTPAPTDIPKPPQMATPQPTATAGSPVSNLPPVPQVPSAQGNGEPNQLPAKPGSTQTLQFPQLAGTPQLIPRSQAQFNAGMGQAPPPQPPLTSNPFINQTAQMAAAPSQLPPRPSTWRQILGTLAASSAGGAAFAPMIEYGPKGLAQIQAAQQQQQRFNNMAKVAPDVRAMAGTDVTSAENVVKDEANKQTRIETERKNRETEYGTNVGHLITGGASIMGPGEQTPEGYSAVPVTKPDGTTIENWKLPSKTQLLKEKKDEDEKDWQPIGAYLKKKLNMDQTAETKVSPALLEKYYSAAAAVDEKDKPTVASLARDAAKGDQVAIKALKLYAETEKDTKTSGEPGTWQPGETTDGKPILYNSKTGQIKDSNGIYKPGTADKKAAAQEKLVGPGRDALAYADRYLSKTDGDYTGAGDEALLEKYFELAKPSSGFRMSQQQLELLQNSRSWMESAEGKAYHATKGTWFSEKQRKDIVGTMRTLVNSKQTPGTGGTGGTLKGHPAVGQDFGGSKIVNVKPLN